MGLTILLDVAHSYTCKNVPDGINELHVTDHYLYFHEGGKGRHKLWVSHLFNYGVLLFIPRNLRFYMDEYQFDGFRLDVVISMIHTHHGIGAEFSGGYHVYFGDSDDLESIVYLMLVCALRWFSRQD